MRRRTSIYAESEAPLLAAFAEAHVDPPHLLTTEEQMQTKTGPTGTRWSRVLLGPLAVLAAFSGAVENQAFGQSELMTAENATAALPMYHIVPLSDDLFAFGVDINNRGQAAFTELFRQPEPGVYRARFFDGKTVRTIGNFGGNNAWTFALNERGQVTGFAENAQFLSHAYRWSLERGLVDLNRPGMGSSFGVDINNRGEVVGGAEFLPSGTLHAARWSASNVAQDLGTLAGGRSQATATNEHGVVVGWSDASASTRRPFRWTQATGMQALGSFASETAQASDVNNAGYIVGAVPFQQNGTDHAFLWSPHHGLMDLGTGSGKASSANRINDKGMVIGFIDNTPAYGHGFVWTRDSGLIEIGGPNLNSEALDLNNRGQVVGQIGLRAYVWTRTGGVVDLNTRICNFPAGLVLRTGWAINDRGEIVVATNSGLVLLTTRTILNQRPLVSPLLVTGVEQAGNTLTFTANFTDVDVRDTHTAVWDWGDGSAPEKGTVTEKNGRGSVTAQHRFDEGDFIVTLTITDSTGKSTTVRYQVDMRPAPAATSGKAG
jgi:probable HAF family extracellular repeat protein